MFAKRIFGTWWTVMLVIAGLPPWILSQLEWPMWVIIGLVIMLIFVFVRGAQVVKTEGAYWRQKNESIRRWFQEQHRCLIRQSSDVSLPLSLSYEVKVGRYTIADIYPEIQEGLANLSPLPMVFLCLTNNSQESVVVEIQCTIVGGNVPLVTRERLHNIPWARQGRIERNDILAPHTSSEVVLVTFRSVGLLHKGFAFPSFSNSTDRKLGYCVEGRISTYRYGQNREIVPYTDVEIKIIASSAVNENRIVPDMCGAYHISIDRSNDSMKVASNRGE
jgi:hypothetical protein